jgi:hypothetical protein
MIYILQHIQNDPAFNLQSTEEVINLYYKQAQNILHLRDNHLNDINHFQLLNYLDLLDDI